MDGRLPASDAAMDAFKLRRDAAFPVLLANASRMPAGWRPWPRRPAKSSGGIRSSRARPRLLQRRPYYRLSPGRPSSPEAKQTDPLLHRFAACRGPSRPHHAAVIAAPELQAAAGRPWATVGRGEAAAADLIGINPLNKGRLLMPLLNAVRGGPPHGHARGGQHFDRYRAVRPPGSRDPRGTARALARSMPASSSASRTIHALDPERCLRAARDR
jgi:hypothetical protein